MDDYVAVGTRCSHCGKALPLGRTGLLACPACHGQNYVEPLSRAGQSSSSGGGVALVAVALALLLSLAVGGVALFFVIRSAGVGRGQPAARPGLPAWMQPSPERPSSAQTEIVSWVGSGNAEPPCLADADGDGAPDVVGFGAVSGGVALMAVGATSGAIVWQNPDVQYSNAGLVCDGRGAMVLTSTGDFTVRGINPRTGAVRWAVKLRDAPRDVSFGDRCLVVTAIDDSRTSLSLVAGTPQPCPSAPPVRKRWDIDRAPFEAGGHQIAFSTVPKGSPRIVVTASRGAAAGWQQTLEIATDPGSLAPPHALSAAGILVAGQKPGSQVVGVVLLDAATGSLRASRDIVQKEVHGGTFFMRLAPTPTHLFVQTFGKLYALRLPKLEVLWEAGSMW